MRPGLGEDVRHRHARHCDACDHEVLHLSAMSAEAAIDALIARRGRPCVRYRTDAAGEIEFAAPPLRGPGPLAVAALALTACAGWTDEPVVPPGELGMCVPDGDDPDRCDDPDAPSPAEPPPPPPAPSEGDFRAQIDGTTMGVLVRATVVTSQHSLAASLVPEPARPTGDRHFMGALESPEDTSYDLNVSLFDRPSTSGPALDWRATVELLRMKRQLRREERQRRREARRR